MHPLYFVMALLYIIMGKAPIFVAFFAATLLHELAHQHAAVARGFSLNRISLMPYGAVLSINNPMPRGIGVMVSIAGVLMNITLITAIFALWWVVPSLYIYTIDFMRANIALAVFNILPAFPLDGARLVMSACNNSAKSAKTVKISGVILGFAMCALGIASAFYYFNATLLIMGGFLIANALIADNDGYYVHIAGSMPLIKNYSDGVRAESVIIRSSAKLVKVLRMTKSDKLITLKVIMSNGERISVEEDRLGELLSTNSLNSTLESVLHKQN